MYFHPLENGQSGAVSYTHLDVYKRQMANEGYDTCPLEGLDSRRLKRTLKLPHGAEINMAIPCGIRDGNKGIWGERCRVPFEDVYRKL